MKSVPMTIRYTFLGFIFSHLYVIYF